MVFGEGEGFASSGVMEAFLVEFYKMLKNKEFELLRSMNHVCYRERIEQRTPGIVFAIEMFHPDDCDKKITMIEEEILHVDNSSLKIKSSRMISIILPPSPTAKLTIKQISGSINTAMKNVMKIDEGEYNGAHGLQCFRCVFEGEDRGFFNTRGNSKICSKTTNKENKHLLNNFDIACEQPLCKNNKPVIKRLAYGVS